MRRFRSTVLAVVAALVLWAGAAHADTPPVAASASPAVASGLDASPVPASPAAEAPPAAVPEDEGPPTFGKAEEIDWGRQMAITVVWLLVVCGAAWFVLRMVYAKGGMLGMPMGRRRLITVLDRHVLGPQKQILVIEVGGKVLVVGVADHGMNTLSELRPEDVRSGAVQPVSETPTPAFQDQLSSLFGRRNPPE